jgi:hypothetical protein
LPSGSILWQLDFTQNHFEGLGYMRIASRIDSLAVWFLHKTIFRVWDTGGLLTGSILWHFDYYYFKKIVAVADLQYYFIFM